MKKVKVYKIGVGTKVWYKGENSGIIERAWKKWEVCAVIEGRSRSPRLLLRLPIGYRDGDSARYDYTVVDMMWTRCFPDTASIRKLLLPYNEAMKLIEKADARLEVLSVRLSTEIVREPHEVHRRTKA